MGLPRDESALLRAIDDNLRSRFWAKVDTSGGEGSCWKWNGAKLRAGYGVFQVIDGLKEGGTTYKAHRVAFVLEHGPVPVGMFICHRCDNPACVNPSHLFAGSAAANVADKVAKNRQARGPLLGPDKKFSDQQIRDIRSDHRSQTAIGRAYGVSQGTIGKILRRERYKHVV